jgi:hypothetical protein
MRLADTATLAGGCDGDVLEQQRICLRPEDDHTDDHVVGNGTVHSSFVDQRG